MRKTHLKPQLLCCLLSLCIVHNAFGQQPPRRTTKERDRAQAAALREALSRVRGLTERARNFQFTESKVNALAGVADVVWKHDEAFARKLFLEADELLRERETDTSATDDADDRAAKQSRLILRSSLVAYAARHDAALAKKFSDAAPEANRTLVDLYAAQTLLYGDNPTEAAKFIERSVENGWRGDATMLSHMLLPMLQRLRATDRAAADRAFLRALAQLALAPKVDANDLLRIGNYPFAAPSDPARPENSVVNVTVGNVGIVSLAGDRADVAPEIKRAYLTTATGILSRPVADAYQRQLYYVAAYQLMDKAKIYQTELIAPLGAAMQTLAPDVPAQLTQTDAAYARLRPRPQAEFNFDKLQENLAKQPDVKMRDQAYLNVARQMLGAKDFVKARRAAELISDAKARERVLTLIDFNRAAASLERDEDAQSFEIARKLQSGIERATLLLAIAQARVKAGRTVEAFESLSEGIKEIKRIEDDPRRPMLLMSAANIAVKFDKSLAIATLDEAVKEINALVVTPESARRMTQQQTVSIGSFYPVLFPLTVKDLRFDDLSRTLRSLAETDMEMTWAALANLKNENTLALSIIAVTTELLNRTEKKRRNV